MGKPKTSISDDDWPDIMLTSGEWEYRSKPGNTVPVYQVYTKLDRCARGDGHCRIIADRVPSMDDAQATACLPELLQAIRLAVAHYDGDESRPECIRYLKKIYDKAR